MSPPACRCGCGWSLLILGLLAMALVVTGIAGPALLRRYLVQRVDIQLAQTVAGAAQDCRRGAPSDDGFHGGAAPLNAYYAQCFDPSNKAVGPAYLKVPDFDAANTQTLPKLPVLDPAAVEARLNQPFTVSGQNGGPDWEVLIWKPPPNPRADAPRRPRCWSPCPWTRPTGSSTSSCCSRSSSRPWCWSSSRCSPTC